MTKSNILIVEDNMIIAIDIQDRLESFGYAVPTIATTGEQAIAKTAELKPDLIIMDIGLNGNINGIETVEKIRENFKIPVIYLTGNSDLLKQANITDPYIVKPFEDEELKSLIASLLDNPGQKHIAAR
ncbi:MAG TPA: response regulator [Thermodesulfobacteriota bacterium]|nr:response regulator [Thermodesulfobacteriota bacterium]